MKFINGECLEVAAHSLLQGNLVAFPTETVFGLGANAQNKIAVERIYLVKNRPRYHPLILHVLKEDLDYWCEKVPAYALKLIQEFWPGPLTLILNLKSNHDTYFTGGQNSVAVRNPSHSIAMNLLKEFQKIGGKGIVAPSANKYGRVTSTSSKDVVEELGNDLLEDDVIIEGKGKLNFGVESTIIDCTERNRIIGLRPGPISDGEIELITGMSVDRISIGRVSPGNVKSHYRPNAKVILNQTPLRGDGFFALSYIETPPDVIRLGSPKDADSYAQQLYSALRLADELKLNRVVFVTPEGKGIELAIRDRLEKASSKHYSQDEDSKWGL